MMGIGMVVEVLVVKEGVLGEWCVVMMLEMVCKLVVFGVIVCFEVGVGQVVGFLDVVYLDVGVQVVDVGGLFMVDIVLCVQLLFLVQWVQFKIGVILVGMFYLQVDVGCVVII